MRTYRRRHAHTESCTHAHMSNATQACLRARVAVAKVPVLLTSRHAISADNQGSTQTPKIHTHKDTLRRTVAGTRGHTDACMRALARARPCGHAHVCARQLRALLGGAEAAGILAKSKVGPAGTQDISEVAQWLACWAQNPKVRGSKPRFANCWPAP